MARPCSRGGPRINRRARDCRSEGQDPRIRTLDLPTGRDGLGVRVDIPRLRQAWWSKWGTHSSPAAKELGSEPAGRTGEDSADPGGDPKGFQRLAVRREEGLAGGPDRSGRLRSRRGSCETGGTRREG